MTWHYLHKLCFGKFLVDLSLSLSLFAKLSMIAEFAIGCVSTYEL